MIDQRDGLADMLAEAQLEGLHEQPTLLLDALHKAGIGIAALSNEADVEPFFAALISEFGYFSPSVPGRPPLPPEPRRKWICLFRWVFSEMTAWTVESDPVGQKLGAILIIAQAARGGHQVWAAVPEAVKRNAALMKMLKAVIRSTAVQFAARGGAPEPIWEREAVEKFKVADKSGDWAKIGASLRLFENQPLSFGSIFTQSARLLDQFGPDHLVEATSAVKQTIVALQLAAILGRSSALSLAAASDNPYVQFAAIYWAFSTRQRNEPLTEREQTNTSLVLSRVAGEQDRWEAWMKAFNTYPIRYPLLQKPLGIALATANEPAVQAYVASVQLYPWRIRREQGRGRHAVADCLRTFYATALPAQRQILWAFAYERWKAWDFASADENQHLFSVHWSDLDFAVVAFASECFDDGERRQQLDDIRRELQDLDLRWHSSVSEVWTAWNRLCSRFQPFAHAIKCIESGYDWLSENEFYLPFKPETSGYLAAKFRMEDI